MRLKAKSQGGSKYEFFDLDTLKSVIVDDVGNTEMLPISLGTKTKEQLLSVKRAAQSAKERAIEQIEEANFYLAAITAEE